MQRNEWPSDLRYRHVFPFTTKDIDWSLNPTITAEYKKILTLRNSSKSLRVGRVTSYSTDEVCAFEKKKEGIAVFVLSNLRNREIAFTWPKKLKKQVWTDAFTGLPFRVSDHIILQPYSYVVINHQER